MKPLLCAFALLMIVAAGAFAQFETAVVLGTVRDASESAVPDAKITLLNIETGIQASATTDENGSYLFNNVKIGRDRKSTRLNSSHRSLSRMPSSA